MKKLIHLSIGLVLILCASTNAYAQPANDLCSGAQSITPDGSCVAGTTLASTDNWTGLVGCQSGGTTHEDVWYTFVSTGTTYTGTVTTSAPWTGNVEFTLATSATGCAGPFTIVGSSCGAAPLNINIPGLTIGATYYFTISNRQSGDPGPFSVCSTTSGSASCSDNGSCSTPQVITYTTGTQTCLTDCNTGAPAGPDFSGNNCFDYPNPTVWYQVTTGASSASINIALTSADMPNPYFSVFTTANCTNYNIVNCTQGAAGSASATVIIAANTTYIIAVSNNGAATGNFDLCITVNNDNSACNITNALTVTSTSMGSPLNGPYQPGEIVGFCYSITDYQTTASCNYLQGIVPTFGNGWDPVSFGVNGVPVNITTPLVTAGTIAATSSGDPFWACRNTPAGTWGWFPAGAVTYNNIVGSLPPLSPMPAGWYFLSSYDPLTGNCSPDPTDPDNSFGDNNFPGCTNTLDWNVCFTLQVKDISACTSGQTTTSVLINTYADGEIGVWNSVGCTADASGAASFSTNICCTAAPTVTTPVNYCINDVAVPLTATGTSLLWYTTATGGVGSATAPTPSTLAAGTTNYYVSQTTGGCEGPRALIAVIVNPLPTATISGTTTICPGNTATLTVVLTGIAPWSITYTLDGASPTTVNNILVSPYTFNTGVAGTYAITNVTDGNTCSNAGAGSAVVTVNPAIVVSNIVTTCSGVNYTVTFDISGGTPPYTVTGGGGTLVGSTFTSNLIASGVNYAFDVNDATNCASQKVDVDGVQNCGCAVTGSVAGGGTACTGSSAPNVVFTLANGTVSPYTLTYAINGVPQPAVIVSAGFPNSTYTIASPGAGTYTIVSIQDAACTGSGSGSASVTLLPLPTATVSGGGTICAGNTTNVSIALTGTGPWNLTYAINGTNQPAVIGINSSPYVISTSTAGNYTVTALSDANCTGTSFIGSATVIVNPNATITLTSAAPTTNQTLCVNTAITNITYTVAGGGTGAGVVGLPAGVTGSFAAGTFTISGTPTATGTFNYTITTTGTCTQATASGTITVNPDATITLTSAAATTNQTLCINTAITNITYTVAGGGTGAGVVGLPAGVSGSFGAGTFTISGTPTATGTFNYTVTTTGTCTQATANGTITVNPDATITLTSAAPTTNQTLCVSTAITNITYTVAGGGTGAGVVGLPAGVSGSFAAGTFTISGTPTATGTFNYTITTTGTCTQATATGTITVTPDNTVSAASSSPTVCINTAMTNITHTTTGATGIGAAVGLPAGVTASWAGGVITISGTPTASGTFNYSIPLTGGCGAVNATGTITVVLINTASAPSSTPTVCINTAITNITHTTAGATGIGAAVGLPAGVTASWAAGVITISGIPTASGTFNYSIPLTGGCGAVNATGTITVTPNNTVSAASSSPTVCINTAITNITHTTTGATGIGAAVGLPAGVTASWAAGVITISGTPTASGTFNYSIPLTGGCGAVNATGTITVNPDATITLTSAAATTNQTLCVNTAITNITYTVAGGGTGAGVVGLPAGVSGSFGAGTFTISGTPTATGTFNYTITTTGTCTQATATGTITVNPNATITLTSAASTTNQTLCVNAAITDITYTIAGGGTGAGVIGLPAGVTGSFAAGTFTISGTPTASGTFNYTVTTTGTCAQVTATGSIIVNSAPNFSVALTNPSACGGSDGSITLSGLNASTAYDITYNSGAITNGPTSFTSDGTGQIIISGLSAGSYSTIIATLSGCSATQAGPYSLNDPGSPAFAVSTTDPTTCEGTDGSITLTGLTASTSYMVTYTNGATVVGPSAMSSDVSGNILISGLTQGSYSNITISLAGCSTSQAGPYALTDPALPVFGVSTSPPTTCGGTDGSITLTGLTASTSYMVTYTDGATVVGPSAISSDVSGNIVIGGLTQGSYSDITVSLTGCNTTDAGPYTLTPPGIPATPTANGSPYCQGATINPITVTGAGGTYTWYSDAGLTTIVSTGSPYTPPAVSDTLYVTETSAGCESAADTVVITINPLPAAPTAASATYCQSDPINPITASGTGGTLNWYSDAGLTTLVNTGTSYTPPASNATYYVTETVTGCTGPSTAVTITINPLPTASAVSSQTLTCLITTTTLDGSLSSAGVGYNWTGPGIVSGATTVSPTVNAGGTYSVTVTDPLTTCSNTTSVPVLSDKTPPTADAGTPQLVGCGIPTATLNGSASSSGANITYIWTGGNIVSGSLTTQPVVDLAGTYTITVTNTNNGCTNTDVVTVTPAPAPVADFTADPTSGTPPLTVNFNNTNPYSSAYTYTWNFGDGSAPLNSYNAPPYIYNTPGTYPVTLTVTNNGQCPSKDSVTIIVFDDFTIIIPNIFTPNGDTNNDMFKVISTGVESLHGAIYDRWGLKLFEWDGVSNGWDGRTNSGLECVDGTYYYIITVKDQAGKEHPPMKGFIQLVK